MGGGRWVKFLLRVRFQVRMVKGYVVGKGVWVEAGGNLLQYCHVGYVFGIISNRGLFVSVKLAFI
jgi:hypothetical protein